MKSLSRSTTHMGAHNDHPVMTVQTGPHAKDHSPKKPAGKNFHRDISSLDALAEYSLSGFLENEPDLYTISDIRVRYR